MPVGTEAGLGPGDTVLHGDPAPPTERDTAAPTFRPISIVAKRLDRKPLGSWYGGRPRPVRHCVTWGPQLPPTERGTAAPLTFRPTVLWHGRPSQQLLSCCCAAHVRLSLGMSGLALPIKIFLPFKWEICTPLNTWFLGSTRLIMPNGISIGSSFLHSSRQTVLYFTMGRRPPPQNCPFSWVRCEPPSNTWFRGPSRVLNPNGISIDSAAFAGLTSVTNRPTDRRTDHATRSVTIVRIYVHSTATWPKMLTSGQSILT